MKYSEAARLFKKARCSFAGYRLPGRMGSTRLIQRADGSYGIKLHNTVVVTIHADDTYTILHNGWTTKTTRERIELYSPACIISQQGTWYLWDRARQEYVAEFEGPLTINSAGIPINKADRTPHKILAARIREEKNRRARERRRERKIENRIKKTRGKLIWDQAASPIAEALYD